MLHCDGNLADMEAVARGTGPLGANGLRALAEVQTIRRRPRAMVSADAAAEVAATLAQVGANA